MARYFDGIDDGIVSSQQVYIQSYNWLVSVWFRTSVASGRKIVGAESGDYYHPHLYVDTNGYLRWGCWDGERKTITTPFTVTDNVWRNAIGVVMWNNSIKLWVDGNYIGGQSFGQWQNVQLYWKLAHYKLIDWPGSSGDGYFTGEIADVRIYRFPLGFNITDDIVIQVYKSSFRRQPALRQYLYIWYPLWERSNPSSVLDHSGRYDNGTVIGTTYVDDPVQIGGSMVTP
jgi:hypothetical protein